MTRLGGLGDRMIELLHEVGANTPLDMSEVLMYETIDAIAKFGFDTSYHAIEAIQPGLRCDLLEASTYQTVT